LTRSDSKIFVDGLKKKRKRKGKEEEEESTPVVEPPKEEKKEIETKKPRKKVVFNEKKSKIADFPLVSPIVLPTKVTPMIRSVSQQIREAGEKDKQSTFNDYGSAWFSSDDES